MYKFIFLFFYFFSISFAEEIFTIEIDGSNLPNESANIELGEELFSNICSDCHGFSGEGLTGPELVGISSLKDENISKTIGNFWPYAPKIFDYVKRAKRDSKGQYFSNKEVFAITGYLLKLNGLFNGKIIDKESLLEIKMPNRDGFISEYY